MASTPRFPSLVGGHLALDFANTGVAAGGDESSDVLRNADEFTAWCVHAGVPSASLVTPKLPQAAEAAFLHGTRQLRAALTSATANAGVAAGQMRGGVGGRSRQLLCWRSTPAKGSSTDGCLRIACGREPVGRLQPDPTIRNLGRRR